MRKKKGILRQLFGLSQAEMADFLKISRAQWSMFESNKADLPHDAKLEFAAMLAYVESAKGKAVKKGMKPIRPNEEATKELKLALMASQHRQGITSKKIDRLQKKQANAEAALRLKGYFENNKEAKGYMDSILQRAEEDSQVGASAELIMLGIKLNLLRQEEILLKEALEVK